MAAGIQAGDVVWTITGDRSQLNKSLKGARADVKGLTADFTSASRKIGAGMTAAGAAITGALGLAAKSAMDFKTELASVNTLGVKDLGKIEKTVKDVSASFGLDLTASVKAAYQAISAGASEAELPNILAAAAKAASAGMTDLSTSVELGLGTMNAYGGEVKSVTEVFDLAFVAVKNGVTTFEELSASTGKVAPIFKAAGLGADEMFASIAALTKGGIATAEAVTGMKAAVTGIIKPTADMEKAFEDVGGPMAALQELGLQGFLDAVKEKTGGNVSEMGKLFGSVEGLAAVLALSGGAQADFVSNLEEMQSGVAATDEAFRKLVESDPGFAFRQLKSEIQVLAVDLGTALLPVLKELIDVVGPVIRNVREWVSANPQLTSTLVIAGGAVGGLMLALGPLLIVLPGLISAFGLLSGGAGIAGAGAAAVGATGAVAGLAAVLGPVVLGAAIVGTGVLLFDLAVNLSKLKDMTDRLSQSEETFSFIVQDQIALLEENGTAVDRSTLAGKSNEEQMKILERQLLSVIAAEDATTKSTDAAALSGERLAEKTKRATESEKLFSETMRLAGRSASTTSDQVTGLSGATRNHIASLNAAQGSQQVAYRLITNIGDSAWDTTAALRAMNQELAAGGQGFASGGIIPGLASGGLVPGIPNIPSFAKGGRVVRVGEEGEELVALPIGSRVLSHGESKAAVRDAVGGRNVTVTATFGDIVVPGTDNPLQVAEDLVEIITPILTDRLEDALAS